jgi:hypothetical protein
MYILCIAITFIYAVYVWSTILFFLQIWTLTFTVYWWVTRCHCQVSTHRLRLFTNQRGKSFSKNLDNLAVTRILYRWACTRRKMKGSTQFSISHAHGIVFHFNNLYEGWKENSLKPFLILILMLDEHHNHSDKLVYLVFDSHLHNFNNVSF